MLEGLVVADRYRLVAPLGRGGHADVYEAVHLPSGAPVALKLLRPARHADPQVAARFDREVRAVRRLRHPNTVRALDSGQMPDGTRYLALELVDGATLARVVGDAGRLPVARAIHIARQILGSVGEAHAEGLVHRDLKPDNILIADHVGLPDHVKVVDFGVARDVDADSLTTGDALVGTPAWMAPEQWLSSEVDARTDLYAVGALLHFMVAGEPPFGHGAAGSRAAASMSLMDAHLKTTPPRLDARVPSCPRAVADLVLRLLAKSRGDRPRDAEAAIAALDACAPAAAAGEVVPSRPRTPWHALAVVAVVAVALAFTFGRASSPTPSATPSIAARALGPTPPAPPPAELALGASMVLEPTTEPEPPAASLPPPVPSLHLASEPPGARVTVVETGLVLASATPSRAALSAEVQARLAIGDPVTLEFRRAGYLVERRPLDHAGVAAGELAVRLAPAPTPRRAPDKALPPLRTP